MISSDEVIKDILRMVKNTYDEELDCDEFYQILDQFVDAKTHGEDVLQVMPLMVHHLDLCRGCFEEYEALMRMIQAEEDSA